MRWLDSRWYKYLWQRKVPDAAKWGLLVITALVLVGAGYMAVGSGESAAGGTGASAYIVRSSTVYKQVTVRKNGKTAVKRVPFVTTVRLAARPVTVVDQRTITANGQVRTQNVYKVRYVPVTKTVDRLVTNVVTRNGETRTLVTTRPTTVQQTVSRTLTNLETVTNSRTITNTETQVTTVNGKLVTTTVRTTTTAIVTTTNISTVVRTITDVRTVTDTRTITNEKTVTDVRTVTTPVTVPVTVTVTIPKG
jgi:hypothetical protein